MRMPAQRSLEDVAMGVHKARQQRHVRQRLNNCVSRRMELPDRRESGNTARLVNGDDCVSLQTGRSVNIFGCHILHSIFLSYFILLAFHTELPFAQNDTFEPVLHNMPGSPMRWKAAQK